MKAIHLSTLHHQVTNLKLKLLCTSLQRSTTYETVGTCFLVATFLWVMIGFIRRWGLCTINLDGNTCPFMTSVQELVNISSILGQTNLFTYNKAL